MEKILKLYGFKISTEARDARISEIEVGHVEGTNKIDTLIQLVESYSGISPPLYCAIIYGESHDKNPIRYLSEKAVRRLDAQSIQARQEGPNGHLLIDVSVDLWDAGQVIQRLEGDRWVTLAGYHSGKWAPQKR